MWARSKWSSLCGSEMTKRHGRSISRWACFYCLRPSPIQPPLPLQIASLPGSYPDFQGQLLASGEPNGLLCPFHWSQHYHHLLRLLAESVSNLARTFSAPPGINRFIWFWVKIRSKNMKSTKTFGANFELIDNGKFLPKFDTEPFDPQACLQQSVASSNPIF